MVSDYYATDVNVAYDWDMTKGRATAQLGVNNLFDTRPAYVANGFTAGSDPTAYDYMGRYVYVRLSYDYFSARLTFEVRGAVTHQRGGPFVLGPAQGASGLPLPGSSNLLDMIGEGQSCG
jgi:hypothetical protein